MKVLPGNYLDLYQYLLATNTHGMKHSTKFFRTRRRRLSIFSLVPVIRGLGSRRFSAGSENISIFSVNIVQYANWNYRA